MSMYYYGFIDTLINYGFVCTISKDLIIDESRFITFSYMPLNNSGFCTIEIRFMRNTDGSMIRSIKAFLNRVKILDKEKLFNKQLINEINDLIDILKQDNVIKDVI